MMDTDLHFSPEQKVLIKHHEDCLVSFKCVVIRSDRELCMSVSSANNPASLVLSRSKKSSIAGFFDQERFHSAGRGVKKQDSEDDIPIIPDVEELQDDDQLGDIADAPVVSTNVPSLSELNADLKKQSLFKFYDNINVGLLSTHLYKESEIREEDAVWSWDLLFTEVSSELRSEWEKNNSTKL